MKMSIFLVASVLVLMSLSGIATASTTCYVCSSSEDDHCGENDFSHVLNIGNTESDCNYCTKSVGRLAGIDATERGCASTCVEGGVNFFGTGGQMACCQSLLCNSATYVRPAAVMAALMTSLAYFLF